jgi:hypothetical protein
MNLDDDPIDLGDEGVIVPMRMPREAYERLCAEARGRYPDLPIEAAIDAVINDCVLENLKPNGPHE